MGLSALHLLIWQEIQKGSDKQGFIFINLLLFPSFPCFPNFHDYGTQNSMIVLYPQCIFHIFNPGHSLPQSPLSVSVIPEVPELPFPQL